MRDLPSKEWIDIVREMVKLGVTFQLSPTTLAHELLNVMEHIEELEGEITYFQSSFPERNAL